MSSTIYFILPTYNESKSIFYLLKDINSLKKLDYNVNCAVIDDASSMILIYGLKKVRKNLVILKF